MLKFLKLPDKNSDPKPFYFILAGGILLVAMSFTLMSGSNERAELSDRHDELENRLGQLDRSIAKKQAETDVQKNESIVEATGLDPKVITSDAIIAEDYFNDAFNWTSGSEYDSARDAYNKSLGSGNSFTASYMPEDTKIERSDGKQSYIDFKNLKSRMDGIFVVPITAEGERVRYAAFVRHYMHTDAQDLNNLEALTPSEAIIEFTVAGSGSDRTVSEVEAWSGFTSTIE